MKEQGISFLSTKGLSIGYGDNQNKIELFQDLDLVLYARQLVCFMGPNGIGKSSLIRTLAGLQKPLSGTINIESPSNRSVLSQQISVVLTDRISSLNMTVYDIIAFGRYPYLDWSIRLGEKDKQIIDSAISQVQIQSLTDKKLHELSDGQLQMAMIARALAQDTPIILLDEPTAHLDLNNRVEIMKLLRNLSRTTSKAILASTHELDLALQLADWIWLAGRDKNILTGMPEDLVLNGSFDTIFQFKGFDLRTGKVQLEKNRSETIGLQGEGYEYLWTKNALERHGFEVSNETGAAINILLRKEKGTTWQVERSGRITEYTSLNGLINSL